MIYLYFTGNRLITSSGSLKRDLYLCTLNRNRIVSDNPFSTTCYYAYKSKIGMNGYITIEDYFHGNILSIKKKYL
jgi:hypothetical protein